MFPERAYRLYNLWRRTHFPAMFARFTVVVTHFVGREIVRGIDILVGTPGRIIDCLDRGVLKFSGIKVAIRIST